jgi:predicted Fe-S protein YdhL (DUF1289 family)
MSLPDFISPNFIEIVPVERIETPCVNVCRIGKDRLCEGCFRTIDEIANWRAMTPAQREAVMTDLANR